MKAAKSGHRGVYWRKRANGGQECRLRSGGKERGEWCIRWKCSYSHLHRERIGPKALAVHEYHRRKVQARTDGYCPHRAIAPSAVLFGDALKDFLAYAKANKRSYVGDCQRARRLQADFGGKLMDDITPADAERWKATLAEEGRAPATVNRYLALLKTVCAMAVRNRKTKDNPTHGVKLFRENNARVRYLTDEEEPRLMAALPEYLRPIVRFAILTGLRRGEQFSLRWENVDFHSRTLTVPRSKHGEARSVPLNAEAVELLRRLPRRLGEPWVFVQPNGEPYQDTPRVWDAARKAAGLADFRWHDLRHTTGSRLAMAGVGLHEISVILGHKTLAMTRRYAHLSPEYLRRAVETLSQVRSDTGSGTGGVGTLRGVVGSVG